MRFIAIILTVCLIGCSSMPLQEVRESSESFTITLDENYQSVYRRILEKFRTEFASECIQNDLYSDIMAGHISYFNEYVTKKYWLVIDIKGAGDVSTVSVYWVNKYWEKRALKIRGWILEGQ